MQQDSAEPSRNAGLILRTLTVGSFWILGTSPAFGQELLLEVSGDTKQALFGSAIAAAGDVNADGYPDMLVGIPGEPKNNTFPGSVRVVSGRDGAILQTLYGSTDHELFGQSVAGGFDLDRDGHADFLVAAPSAPFGSNRRALLFSGRDGSVLWSADGDDKWDGFGLSLANCGDVNQDGARDWVVGAPYAIANGNTVGFIRVFSGLDGSLLYTIYGSENWSGFSEAVSGAGDVDFDGHDDIVVGSPYSSLAGRDAGRVQVYSGRTASLIHDIDGSGDQFLGWSVSEGGDLDLDGTDDFLAGSLHFRFDWCSSGAGFAEALSGANASVLYSFGGGYNGDVFGFSVGGCGEMNADGWPDFIIGAPQFDAGTFPCYGGYGYARLYSGRTGMALYTFTGRTNLSNFGIAVSGVGDLNGDGLSDVMVGASAADDAGTDFGSAYVFSGNDLFLNAAPRHPVAGNVLTLSTREGPAGNPVALFMVDVNGAPRFTLLSWGLFDSGLGFDLSGNVPPGLTGYEITFQSFAIGATGKVIDSAPEVVTFE